MNDKCSIYSIEIVFKEQRNLNICVAVHKVSNVPLKNEHSQDVWQEDYCKGI